MVELLEIPIPDRHLSIYDPASELVREMRRAAILFLSGSYQAGGSR